MIRELVRQPQRRHVAATHICVSIALKHWNKPSMAIGAGSSPHMEFVGFAPDLAPSNEPRMGLWRLR